MKVISKSTGKTLTYKLCKVFSKFKLYKVYEGDRYLYKTTKEV